MDSVDQSIRNLKDHMKKIANPCLLDDIKNKLIGLDSSGRFIDCFLQIDLPDKTLKILSNLDAQIKDLKNSQEGTSEAVESIFNNLKALSNEQYEETKLWEPLKLFFERKEVKNIENKKIKKLLKCIYKEDIEKLRKKANSFLKKEKTDIDSFLSGTPYKNLDGLMLEIIDSKPKSEAPNLLNDWNKDPSFFLEKNLQILLESPDEPIHGLIRSCNREENLLKFVLDDKSEISICKELNNKFNINISTTVEYKLWDALKTNKFENEEIFKVEVSSDYFKFSVNYIPTGNYSVKPIDNYTSVSFKNTIEKIIVCKEISNLHRAPTSYLFSSKINTSDSESNLIEIYEIDEENLQRKKLGSLLASEINNSYSGIKQKEFHISNINPEKVVIKECMDENSKRTKYLNSLNDRQDSALKILMEKQNIALLHSLLDNLIANKLVLKDITFLQEINPQLARKIEEISKDYRQNLNEIMEPHEILKNLITEANYASLVPKSEGLEVTRTMSLLEKASEYIDKIEGKDIVLFVGNTGSGKSSTIAWFMKARIEKCKNAAGEEVVKIENEIDKYPEIGQSLVNSKTLYTQGYSVPDVDPSISFVDCPGFNDTRGSTYDLCTNLSIDQSIQKCRSIKAIVLVIPYQAISMDRGNKIIELVQTINEKFDNLFDLEAGKAHPKVYIIVTKLLQEKSSDLKKSLKSGQTFKVFLEETKNQLSGLKKSDDYAERMSMNKRVKIFESIDKMHSEGKIHFIDIKSPKSYKELEKYISGDEIDKRIYRPMMKTKEMEIKFGKNIEMSTHTWTTQIFKQFFQEIPESIATSESTIEKNNKAIEEAKYQIELNHKIAADSEAQAEKIRSLLEEFKNYEQNIAKYDENFLESFRQKMHTIKANHIGRIEQKIKTLSINKKSYLLSLEYIDSDKKKLTEAITEYENNIKSNEKTIEKLSKGSIKEKLYELDYTNQKTIRVRTVRDLNSKIQTLFADFDIKKFCADYDRLDTYAINGYRGELINIAYIDKDYKIVPLDETLRKAFEEVGCAGKYKAIIEGKNFEYDRRCKAHCEGKKMIYSIITKWNGTDIPWVKITHEMPNEEVNEASIINARSEIIKYRESISVLQSILDEKEKENKDLVPKIDEVNKEKAAYEVKLKEVKDKININQSPNNEIQDLRGELETLEREIKRIESSFELLEEIKLLEEKNNTEVNNLKEKQKKKKYLALVIKTQFKSLNLLRKFVDIVLDERNSQNTDQFNYSCRPETTKACVDFLETYDRYIESLEKICNEEIQ